MHVPAALLPFGVGTAVMAVVAASGAAPNVLGASAGGSCPTSGVGAITKVVSPDVYVNNGNVYGTTKLRARDRLQTSSSGSTRFCVKEKGTRCHTLVSSTLQVRPGPHVIARIDHGYVTCVTTLANVQKTSTFEVGKKKATRVRLKMTDPLFAIAASGAKTVVRVVSGIVEVSARGTTTVVGPMQQVTVPSGKAPKPAEPLVPLTGARAASVESLQSQVPQPMYTPPSRSASPTLRRIFARGYLQLGLDQRAKGATTGLFSSRYFAVLGKHWGLRVAQSGADPASAGAALCRPVFDLYVTAQPDAVGVGAWRLPFFEDESAVVWYLVGIDDNIFRLALRSFLIQTLQSGDYATTYKTAFTRPPGYGIFDGLLSGPGKSPLSSCS